MDLPLRHRFIQRRQHWQQRIHQLLICTITAGRSIGDSVAEGVQVGLSALLRVAALPHQAQREQQGRYGPHNSRPNSGRHAGGEEEVVPRGGVGEVGARVGGRVLPRGGHHVGAKAAHRGGVHTLQGLPPSPPLPISSL